MSDLATFTKSYLDWTASSCEEGDCYPQPAMTESRDGELTMHALAISPRDILSHVVSLALDPDVLRLAFGFDRTTGDGQGTTLDNVFTYVLLDRTTDAAFGIIEYDGQGDVRQRSVEPGEFWHDTQVQHYAGVLAAWKSKRRAMLDDGLLHHA